MFGLLGLPGVSKTMLLLRNTSFRHLRVRRTRPGPEAEATTEEDPILMCLGGEGGEGRWIPPIVLLLFVVFLFFNLFKEQSEFGLPGLHELPTTMILLRNRGRGQNRGGDNGGGSRSEVPRGQGRDPAPRCFFRFFNLLKQSRVWAS